MKAVCILIMYFIFSFVCFSQDLIFPKDMDFGDVPVGNSSMPNIKMLPFTIINNSSHDYLIEHMYIRYNYDLEIAYSGNNISFIPGYIYRYVNGPLEIKSNTSFNLNCDYSSKFFDEISKQGNKLSITVFIYFRKVTDKYLSEDSVTIFARSVESKGTEAFGFKYSFYFCPSGSKYLSDNYFVALVNNTGKDLNVDSVHVEVDGKNLTVSGLFDDNENPVSEVYANSFVRYKFAFDFVKFEKSVGKVKFYTSEINGNNKHYISEDSVTVHYIPYDEKGRIVMDKRLIGTYPGNINKATLSVLTCTSQDLILDSIYFLQENLTDEFWISSGYSFPLNINQNEVKYFELNIKGDMEGSRPAQVCADFRNVSGEIYTKCVDFLIQVIPPSDVFEPFEEKYIVYLFPNPADSKINIVLRETSGCLIKNFEIFDLFGRKVYGSDLILKTEFDISTAELSSGSYVGLTRLNDGRCFHSKIIISR